MADQVVFEGAKVWMLFIYILAFMAVGVMFFQMANINTYKNEINTVLSREGGYTQTAYETISQINSEYKNRFVLEIVDDNGNVLKDAGKPYYSHIYKFGEKIRYRVKTQISFTYLSQFIGNDGRVIIPLNGYTFSYSREANT